MDIPLSDSALKAMIFLLPDPKIRASFCLKIEQIEALILEAAGTMNLTSDREPGPFRLRHTEDAILSAWALNTHAPPRPHSPRMMDVGSGAGLPGLIWAALWPEATITLLESRVRRADFIEHVAEKVQLANVSVACGRAEDLAHHPEHREQYHIVTARAVAAFPVLSELTLPFARIGGGLAAIKSAGIQEELDAARPAIRKLGGDADAIEQHAYERADGKACLVCWVPKIQATPAGYPRLPGVPSKQPILT